MYEEMERLRTAATAQHGVLLSRTVRSLGVSRAQERRLRAQGWLVPVQPGVVLVGGGETSPWQRVVAAWLLCGSGSVVSHMTAARIHKLPGVAPGPAGAEVELSVVRPSHRRPAGCVVHRYRVLAPSAVTRHRGVAVTTAARTLVDLVPRLPPGLLGRTVDEGVISGLWTVDELGTQLAECGRRTAIDDLRQLLRHRDQRLAGRRDVPIEVRVERALAAFRPFVTQHQVVLEGHVFVLDIAWPEFKVVVECEGWEVRSRSRGKFDHERRRDNLLVAHGWTVVRLTSAMSDDEMRATVLRVLLRAAAGR